MTLDAAAALARTLSRVPELDEAAVRDELAMRFPGDRDAVRHGLAIWHGEHDAQVLVPGRRDLD